MNCEEHKAFIKESDQHRLSQVQWVEGAYKKYDKMMEDFNKFKVSTNEQVKSLLAKWQNESIRTKCWIENIDTKQQQMVDKSEM